MKYGEEDFLQLCAEYIEGTYDQHYVGENNIQTVDVWGALGSAKTTTRDTAIKYLMRFGKKKGNNIDDLLKAVHYIVLLHHFTFEADNAIGNDDSDDYRGADADDSVESPDLEPLYRNKWFKQKEAN